MDRGNGGRATSILLCAFVFLFGMEMVRFHVGSLGWYQRDTLGVGALDLIPIALVPFAAGILLPLASRILGLKAALSIGVGLLVVARLANQAVADPAIDHWTSGVAVAAFFGSLAPLTGLGRRVLVGGVLVGLTLDIAIKAHGASLDLAYRPGIMPLVAVAVVGATMIYLVSTLAVGERVGPGWLGGLSLVALGPLLFAHYLVLQSQGWVSAMTGLRSEMVALALVALNVVGLWLVSRLDRSPAVTAAGAVLVAAAVSLAEGPPVVFAVLAVVAIPLAAPLWAALVPDMRGRSLAPAGLYVLLASLAFLAVGFAYYLPLDLRLGFTQAQVRIGAGLLIALFGLVAAFRAPAGRPAVAPGIPLLVAALLLLPASALIGVRSLPAPPDEGPLRVMSYNIHQAYGTGGEMDPEAIAAVILDSGATIVGLQEIPRGGLMNAGTDVLTLLAHRLGWEHSLFFGTTDPVWGNAILSRYPLGDSERVYLPPVGTPFQRGYMAAPASTPIGEVLVINIHLQHINDSAIHEVDPEGDLYDVHTAQLGTVVDEWGGRQPAVLVGDLNARPEWRQFRELLAAGWVDSWEVAGTGPGYTANAADPLYRIDYVLHTADLTTLDVNVVESQASDHFAVVADLAPAG